MFVLSFFSATITDYDTFRHSLLSICLMISGTLFFISDISINRFHVPTALWMECMTGITALIFVFDFRKKSLFIPPTPFLSLTIVYVVFGIANGGDLSSLFTMFISFLLLFNILHTVNNASTIIVVLFLLLSFLSACLGGLQYVGCIPSFHSTFPITATFNNPAGMACLLAVAFPLSLTSFSSKVQLVKIYSLLISVSIAIIILLSASRTAVLSILLTLALYFGKKRFNQKNLLLGMATILLIIILLYLGGNNPRSRT